MFLLCSYPLLKLSYLIIKLYINSNVARTDFPCLDVFAFSPGVAGFTLAGEELLSGVCT